MKHKLYKQIINLIAIGFLSTAFAQKFDKKFSENFKTKKDVEVAINASNTAINVTNWNKNEVQVDAFIEIEGISKDEAEKYFKNWNFEALGNSKKVKIISKIEGTHHLAHDFVFFGDKNFTMPKIDFVIPEIDFDFDFDFDDKLIISGDLDDLEEDMKTTGKYHFEYIFNDEHITINSKEEWDNFKKNKKYKDFKKRIKDDSISLKIKHLKEKKKAKLSKQKAMLEKQRAKLIKEEIKKNTEKAREQIRKAELELNKIDKKKLKEELLKVSEEMKKIKFSFSTKEGNLVIDGKKVKIKKRLEIKVPKDATFNLNTRHCKVKLPNTVAFGKLKYGSFDAHNLNGGNLTIDYSPVNINNLNACTLFLNNVADAKIASVTSSEIHNNSSVLKIIKVNRDVVLFDKFGDVSIESMHPNFNNFILNLKNSNIKLLLSNINTSLNFTLNNSKLFNTSNSSSFKKLNKAFKNNMFSTSSKIINAQTNNIFTLTSDYSSIVIK